MIAYLNGIVQFVSSEFIILNVSGVGYEVFMPGRNIQVLESGQEAEVFVYTYVKEDQLKLFGFESLTERDMFSLLLGISGVGPKAGLAILSAGNATAVHKAVAEADLGFFTNVKGLGKKTAQKIIIELKTKLGSVKDLDLNDDASAYSHDVVEALVQFGFSRKEIVMVLDMLDSSLSEDKLIKEALKHLGK